MTQLIDTFRNVAKRLIIVIYICIYIYIYIYIYILHRLTFIDIS